MVYFNDDFVVVPDIITKYFFVHTHYLYVVYHSAILPPFIENGEKCFRVQLVHDICGHQPSNTLRVPHEIKTNTRTRTKTKSKTSNKTSKKKKKNRKSFGTNVENSFGHFAT